MQNNNTKKIIIILVILFIGILGYFIFFKGEKTETQTKDSNVFFPAGEVGQVDLGKDFKALKDNSDYLSNQSYNKQIPILRKISEEPIAGAIIFKDNSKKNDFYTIRYIEKATGHIYETKTNTLTLERISNKTIPKLNSVKWLDKDNFIFNYLDENQIIKTYSALLTSTATSTNVDLEGVYLQNNIQEITYFDNNLFYLLNSGSDSKGILVDKENIKPKQIFYSLLQEWLINNINDNQILFTSKTTKETYGYAFIFNSTTESFNKVLDKKLNLSTLPNNNLDILYSYNSNLSPKLSLYNFNKKTTIDIPITTFPEKCVWSGNNINIYCGVPSQSISNNSLEDWYKGNVLFSDDIWVINTNTIKIKKIITLSDIEKGGIDVIDLFITKNNDYLIFINKKDYSLWGLQIISPEII